MSQLTEAPPAGGGEKRHVGSVGLRNGSFQHLRRRFATPGHYGNSRANQACQWVAPGHPFVFELLGVING